MKIIGVSFENRHSISTQNEKGKLFAFAFSYVNYCQYPFKIRNDLRQAVENSEIQPYFQPIVLLMLSKIISLGALARWKHTECKKAYQTGYLKIRFKLLFVLELNSQT